MITTLISSFGIFFYSCEKSNNEIVNNKETVLFDDKTESSKIDTKTIFLGGNTKKVTRIYYENSILNSLKSSNDWNTIISTYDLDLKNITRTYLHNSPLSLITIPIKQNIIQGEYLNIYILNGKFLITKIYQVIKDNGYTTYKIKSAKDELYYQFDLNLNNQIGNWLFEKDIPFKSVFNQDKNTSKLETKGLFAISQPCASQSFNACMNCFIIQTCGSDWVCTVACGAFIISCVGGAAAACVLL